MKNILLILIITLLTGCTKEITIKTVCTNSEVEKETVKTVDTNCRFLKQLSKNHPTKDFFLWECDDGLKLYYFYK